MKSTRIVTDHRIIAINTLFKKLECDAFMRRSAIHKGIALRYCNNLKHHNLYSVISYPAFSFEHPPKFGFYIYEFIFTKTCYNVHPGHGVTSTGQGGSPTGYGT